MTTRSNNRETKRRRGKMCLFISTFGEAGSLERKHAEAVVRTIIRPALLPLGYTVIRGDRLTTPGAVNTRIVRELRAADLVVADLTGLNPNVMFEIGVRQAWNLPLVLIAQSNTTIPSGVQGIQVVLYKKPGTLSQSAAARIQARLRKAAKAGVVSETFREGLEAIVGRDHEVALLGQCRDAVGDLVHSLADLRRELKFDMGPEGTEFTQVLATYLSVMFSCFDDKVHVLRMMGADLVEARRVPFSDVTETFLAFLASASDLTAEAASLDGLLGKVRPSRSTLDRALRKLERITLEAKKIHSAVADALVGT